MPQKLDFRLDLQIAGESHSDFRDSFSFTRSMTTSRSARQDFVLQPDQLLTISTDLKLLSLLIVQASKRCDISLRKDSATDQPIFNDMESVLWFLFFDKPDQQIDHLIIRAKNPGLLTVFLAGQSL